MEEEELCAGPAGVLLAESGGCAYFLVSRLEVAPDGGAGAVEVDAHGVHDEGRPVEKLVCANACRSCTSSSALQARWNKRVMLVYSLYSRMV